MVVVGKLTQLSFILQLIVIVGTGSEYYQNEVRQRFDAQKHLESVKQLELRIGIACERWKVNSPVTVNVLLTNKGKDAIKIPDAIAPWFKYQISVIDDSNQQVPRTEFMKKQLKVGVTSILAQDIPPGKTLEERIQISDLYEINSKRGTYKVTLKRQVGVGGKVRYQLASNTITLSVVE